MNRFWKLTNFLFRQMMEKKGKFILLGSLAFGLIGMLARAFPRAAKKGDITHLAVSFLPYEAIVDKSCVMFVFLLGLLLLFQVIYLTMNRYFTNGKGIYTLLMLPVRRKEVYLAFAAAALGMLFVYFAAWLLLMVALYFPVMANYTRVAAQEVFRTSDGTVIQALDAARSNGLYLAFRRSLFLSTCFLSSLWQFLPFLSGLLLALASSLYGGLRVGSRGGQVAVVIGGTLFGLYTAATPLLHFDSMYGDYGSFSRMLTLGFAQTGVGTGLSFSLVSIFFLALVVHSSLRDMEQKNA